MNLCRQGGQGHGGGPHDGPYGGVDPYVVAIQCRVLVGICSKNIYNNNILQCGGIGLLKSSGITSAQVLYLLQ